MFTGNRMWQKALCALTVVACVGAAPINITIDHNVRYQTIVGFGGAQGAMSSGKNFANDLINDAGISVIRFDWCNDGIESVRDYYNAGCRTFIASCWSPPANMKDNNNLNNGGHLLVSKYGAFGDYAISKLNAFKTAYGIELSGISPQNEPKFAEFYGSCIYDGADLIYVADTIGKKIKAAGLKTKLFLPEDMYTSWNSYNQYIVPDSANLRNYAKAFAFHGYGSDGVTPASMSAGVLQRISSFALKYNWEVWQSENGGSLGMNYPVDVIACLRYGKVTVYMKFGLCGDSPGMVGDVNEYYVTGGQKTSTYYAAKCIQKFIRPGSVQLRSVSSDSTTYANFVTFYDPAASALIVSCATKAVAQSITLQGTNLPSTFQKWMTNASTNCVNMGNVSSGSTIDIPANSVVTLYATGYTPPVVGTVVPMKPTMNKFTHIQDAEKVFDIRGRQIDNVKTNGEHMIVSVQKGRVKLQAAGY